jgi:hypothetical protein
VEEDLAAPRPALEPALDEPSFVLVHLRDLEGQERAGAAVETRVEDRQERDAELLGEHLVEAGDARPETVAMMGGDGVERRLVRACRHTRASS